MQRMSLVAAVVLVSTAAHAQSRPNQGRSTNLEIALRGGVALPFGKATDSAGDDLSQTVKFDVPLSVDLNYRFTDEVYAGAYFSYGLSSLGDPLVAACGSGASCSAHTLRVGLGVSYHFSLRKQFDPWLGIAIGYEQAKVSASGPGGSRDATIGGIEFPLMVGVDFRPSPLFGFGPFLMLGLGEYTRVDAGSTSGSISNTALHGWFGSGVRISFTP